MFSEIKRFDDYQQENDIHEKIRGSVLDIVDNLLHLDNKGLVENKENTALIEDICRLRDNLLPKIEDIPDGKLLELNDELIKFDDFYRKKIMYYIHGEATSVEEVNQGIKNFKECLESITPK